MSKKRFKFLLAFLLLIAQTIQADELLILTENLPPLNYLDNGVLVGPAVDIVKEIQHRVGSKTEIQVYPWARAYKMALEERNIILFGMARTKIREKQFNWIGPIARKKDILAAKKDSGFTINSLADAKKVERIGTLRDDAKEEFLKRHGFTNLVPTHDDQRNPKKLILGRIDLWATKIPGMKTICNLSGIDHHDIVEVYTIRQSDISIAISKKTSADIVQRWERAFNDISTDGTILKIQKKWNFKLDDDPFPEIAN